MTRLLVRDLAQLATAAGHDAPLRGSALGDVEVLEDAFVLCDAGRIEAVGRMRDLPLLEDDVEELDGRGLSAIPGLVDCHTHACFAGDRTSKQGFACSWWANQQHATRNTCAKTGEFVGLLQEFDDFLKLLEWFVDAGHVHEGDACLPAVRHARLGLAEGLHWISTPTGEPPHEKQRECHEQEKRQQTEHSRQPGRRCISHRVRDA